MEVARIADFRIITGVLGAGSKRNFMAPLANTGTLGILVLTQAAGVTEENLPWLTGGLIDDVTPDQEDVDPLCPVRVSGIELHVGTVTIATLDILAIEVMVLFARMTVGAEVDFVRL